MKGEEKGKRGERRETEKWKKKVTWIRIIHFEGWEEK